MMAIMNINDKVAAVKLTEHGMKVWNDHWGSS